MKKPKKPSVKITKSRVVLYGSVLLVAILAVSAIFYFRTSKQLAFEEQVETSEQALKEDLQQAAAQNAVRVEAEKAELQKITDAEQAKKSAAETQSAEDKAENRYSNVYGASKVYEATCSNKPTTTHGALNISYDRGLLNAGSPFRVSISTPDGGPLGQVFVNVNGGFSANPSSFSSNGSSTSFTAQYPPGYSSVGMGPSMSTGGPTAYVRITASCNSRSFDGGINLF